MTTRDEALDAAAKCFAEAYRLADTLPVAEAARLAYTPTGPSIDELTRRIAARRAEARAAARSEPEVSERRSRT